MKFPEGCYGDGTLGHQHTRERCADVIESVMTAMAHDGIGCAEGTDLVRQLRGPMSDDAAEEQAAEAWLYYCPRLYNEDHSWGWLDGDFGLWPNEDY